MITSIYVRVEKWSLKIYSDVFLIKSTARKILLCMYEMKMIYEDEFTSLRFFKERKNGTMNLVE